MSASVIHPLRDRRLARSVALAGSLALLAGYVVAPQLPALAQDEPLPGVAEAGLTKSYDRPTFLDSGHVDAFNVRVEDGVPVLTLKEDVTAVNTIRQPEDVELHVKEQARTELPSGNPYVPEPIWGASGYFLPLSQNHDLLWPGWESQQLAGSEYGAPVDIHVTAIDGPGEVYLWTQGAGFDPLASLLIDGSYQVPNTIRQTYLAHVHANWFFTEPGDYWFTVTAAPTHTGSGEQIDTEEHLYLFSVGDFDRVPETVTVDAPANPYTEGDAVELTAAQYPVVDEATWSWQRALPGEDWATIEGQSSSVYSGTATVDGEQLRAVVTNGETSVSSGAVTLQVNPPVVLPTALLVEGLANPYQNGAPVALEAKPDAATEGATYRWEIRTDDGDWTVVEGVTGSVYTGTAEIDGQQIRATIIVDGQDVVTAEPVTLTVTEDEEPGETPTVLTIEGLAESYDVGETITLTAVQDPPTELDHYHWYTRTSQTGEWTVVPGVGGAEYSLTAEAAHDGVQIQARLFGDGHDVVAASEPATLRVTTPDPEPADPPVAGQCWALDIDHGHVDAFNITLVEGRPTLTLKEDVTGSHVRHEPSEVNLIVKEDAYRELPDSDSIPAELRGESVYFLPLNQDQNLLWPGWDSQELNGSRWDSVDIDIHAVDGPGEVYVWSQGTWGELASLLADGGHQLPNTIEQAYFAHVHANWAFTEPGAYYVTVSATVHDEDADVEFTTNTGRYLVSVGPQETLPEGYRNCLQPPSQAPVAPSAGELTEENRGNVSVSPQEVRAGEQLGVTAPEVADAYTAGFLFSDPVLVTDGWVLAEETGGFVATVPVGTELGEHTVVVVDSDNELVGWDDVTVVAARSDDNDDDGGDDDGDDDSTPDPTPDPTPTDDGNGDGGSTTAPVCLSVEEYNRRYGGTTTATEQATSGATGEQTTAPIASADVQYGTEGHFDFGPIVLSDGTFELQVKDDRTAPPVWRDADDVVFVLGDASLRSASSIPDDLGFVAPAGQDVYMIQQIQEAGVPWIGWNTQHETIVNGPGSDGVQLTLEGVEGPGELAVFLNGSFGQLVGERVVDTVGGPTSYQVPANTHQHGNWVFTEPGVYAVTLTVSADGRSDTQTLRFAVGVDDPSAAAAPAGGSGATTDERSGSGSDVRSGQGLTPDGTPCTLPTTGVNTDVAGLAGLSAVAMLLGVAAVIAVSRRRLRIDG